MSVKFLRFKNKISIANEIVKLMICKLEKQKSRKILVSGGTSLNFIYELILKRRHNLSKINFILSDERMVSKKSTKLNSLNIINNFIEKLDTDNKPLFIYPSPDTFVKENKKICDSYKKELSDSPELAIMGVGDDGHICSIFYDKTDIIYQKSPLIICKRTNENFNRISLNMETLQKIPQIIFVITTKSKKKVLNQMIKFKKLDDNELFKMPILFLLSTYKGNCKVYFSDEVYN